MEVKRGEMSFPIQIMNRNNFQESITMIDRSEDVQESTQDKGHAL